MALFFPIIIRVIGAGLLCISIATANSMSIDSEINNASPKLKQYNQINWSQYTLAALKKKVPTKFYGQDISLLPVQSLYFLPTVNFIEMNKAWKSSGNPWPHIIVIANGVYNLEQIDRLISNPSIFKKINAQTYISYRPIYIAPTAKLVISAKKLRLSLEHGAFIMSNGTMFIVDSTLTSWNETTANYGTRKPIPDEELLFYGKQFPRPYLLGLSGSRIYAGNSIFRGLGYKGKTGSFGVSMNKRSHLKKGRSYIIQTLRKKENPTGWLIGNIFKKNFFGYYSNNAKNVIIVGNIFHNNIIYNIDPHDYSSNLLISRNLSYNAKHAHGIIMSREVNNSIIADNLTLKNQGSGIMLDRNSERNLIYNNMTIENQGDGISIFESDNNDLINNISARNYHSGIFVRNSCNIQLNNNYLFRNINAGSEVSVVDIDYLETRNFSLDPYHKKANTKYINNTFDSNITSAISSKNKPGIILENNFYKNSSISYFTGDLEPYNREILSSRVDKEFIYKGINECH